MLGTDQSINNTNIVKRALNLYFSNAICHCYDDSAATKIDAMQIQMHLYWNAKSNQFHDTEQND